MANKNTRRNRESWRKSGQPKPRQGYKIKSGICVNSSLEREKNGRRPWIGENKNLFNERKAG
jgi:hypothetical protein